MYEINHENLNEHDNKQIITLDTPQNQSDPYRVTTDNHRNNNQESANNHYVINKSKFEAFITGRRVKTKKLAAITRELSTLLTAGMPLVPALSALAEQLMADPWSKILLDLAEQVNHGQTFTDALQGYPDLFSTLYINMVAAGEASASLEQVLQKLAETLEKRDRLAAKTKAALIYPSLMAVVAVLVITFLITFVIPNIAKIFLEMNHSLPWPTILLINISGFASRNFLLISAAVIMAAFCLSAYLKTASGKHLWDYYKLKLPLAGNFILKIETARLAGTLGVMLNSGINLIEALATTNNIIQNSYLAGQIEKIQNSVCKGEALAAAIKETGLFPPIFYHMIATGEMSGNLEKQLINIADKYENELEILTHTITAMIEPALMLFMGAVVGFIVLAMLLPIFEINQMF